jgi:hypothetical protein
MNSKTKKQIINAWESAYNGDGLTTGEDYFYEMYSTKKAKPINKFIYIISTIILWALFIGGLYIMWFDGEMNLFINYIFTSFGLLGMLYLNMILYDNLISIKN